MLTSASKSNPNMASWSGRGLAMARRASHIIRVAARFGFATIIYKLGDPFLPRPRHTKLDVAAASLEVPERLRLALEELGPTAIKLGQALASRGDLLPVAYINELRKLQDNVPSTPFEDVKQVIFEELGADVSELFEEFEEVPRASASIGQVHFARLPDGKRVAVKVQHPGVAEAVEIDLHLILRAALLAERSINWCAENHVHQLAQEFVHSLRQELNFIIEAHNTQRLRSNLEDEEAAYVPAVFWNLCTRRVLVIEWIEGAKVGDAEALERGGVDAPAAARAFSHLMLRQIFRDGYFHGDPHGGNVLFTGGDHVAFLDCGNALSLDRNLRDGLVSLLMAALNEDPQEVCDHILDLGAASERTNIELLTADIGRMMARYAGFQSSAEFSLGEMLDDLLSLVFRHGVRMPPSFAAIAKSLVVMEGVCLQLDPNFDTRSAVQAEVRAVSYERLTPAHILQDLMRLVRTGSRYAGLIPRQVSQVLGKLQSGALRVRVSPENLERPLHRLDMMVNRIAFALVVSAVIVSSSSIMASQKNVGSLAHYVTLAYVVGGILLGAWLLLSILKSGRL